MQPSDSDDSSRRTREVLRESEERFRLLVEGVKDYAIFMLDARGRVTTWNPGARRIKGYEAGEIIGEHFSAFYTSEDVERGHPEEMLRIAAAEGQYEEEGERVRKDGSIFWANVVTTALRDGAGDLRGFAKVTRDVTERKRAEGEIRQSEERYRSFIEQSTEGIWRFELDEGVITDLPEDEQVSRFYRHAYLAECNDVLARMYGFTRADEIVGVRLEQLLPRSSPANEEYLLKFVRSGYRLDDAESKEVDREGNPKRFMNNLTGIVEVGRLVRIWGTQRDVTERRRAEEAQRFLSQASAVLSSSLDYHETLSSVARSVVPTLADWCAVDIIEEDGYLERLVIEYPDPDKVPLAYELERRYPPDPATPRGLYHVLRTGEPEMGVDIPEELLDRVARGEEHRASLERLKSCSYMIVPLVTRGRTLGAISFVSAESGRRHGEADLQLATELARRAALAVDNARLYEEAQREIVERRWAQDELRDSRDQLEAILRGAAEGITAQDPSGKVIYANEAAARLTGFSSVRDVVESPPAELIARFELLDEDGYPFPVDRLPGRRALTGEEGAEEILHFRVLATGEERWTIVKSMPIFGEGGTVRMTVNILRDITESKRAEESLRWVTEAERKRIARDLHDGVLQDLSYTTAAIGVIMLQAEDEKWKEQLQAAVDAVRRGAHGLREVVNDLRLEGEEGRLFTDTITSLVKRNRTMAKNVEISLNVGKQVPSAPMGETGTQVSRVIQEALTNARRHSRAKKISVSLGMEGDDLLAEVVDDGLGFGPETTPGVGISSMRERAALSGGDLEIESEVGRGTNVRLRVPLSGRVLE